MPRSFFELQDQLPIRSLDRLRREDLDLGGVGGRGQQQRAERSNHDAGSHDVLHTVVERANLRQQLADACERRRAIDRLISNPRIERIELEARIRRRRRDQGCREDRGEEAGEHDEHLWRDAAYIVSLPRDDTVWDAHARDATGLLFVRAPP